MNDTTTIDLTLPSDQNASGRTLGSDEISLLIQAIESGTLTSTKGNFTKQFERNFADALSVDYAYAACSGTAAVHTAVAAIDPEPGDEIVTTSITDMGALTPILYQGAIPVFADVDPFTCNITAESIERVLSNRTKAIVVTHLFGNPCPMDDIMRLARERDIFVIEDCAQAFLATYSGQPVGTIGDIGCFSLQQGKHITTGEGGVVITNNSDLARRVFLFINKAWGYGDKEPDHYFLALNYRMSELQSAVALAQLNKLADVVERRVKLAERLTLQIVEVEGVEPPYIDPRAVHTFWKYVIRVDDNVIAGGADALGRELRKSDVACAPRYIRKPAFMCQVFQDQRTFGQSRYPFNLARAEAVDYRAERFPGTFAGLENIVVLPLNERYTDEHVDFVARTIGEAASYLRK